jgi:nitrate/nitrite transporter NarK
MWKAVPPFVQSPGILVRLLANYSCEGIGGLLAVSWRGESFSFIIMTYFTLDLRKTDKIEIITLTYIPSHLRGTASTLQATAYNWSGLLAARFFLATAEAAFAPGIPYLLSFFYKRHELGLRCGLYVSAAPLATTFAGALAYGITSGHPAIANWRLLFIIEGLPSVLLAFVAYRYLPDSADTARFLNQEEKQVAKTRALQQTGSAGTARIGHVDLKETLLALKDIKTWIPPLMYFSCNGELQKNEAKRRRRNHTFFYFRIYQS